MTVLSLSYSGASFASFGKKQRPKKIQGRSWQLIIPSEWPNLEGIKEAGRRISRNYYYIEHNHDVDELGLQTKPHWHILLTMSNGRDLVTMKNYFKDFAMADEQEIKYKDDKASGRELEENNLLMSNSFDKISSIHWAKRYLIHADDPGKFQYKYIDVETNDSSYKDLFVVFPSKLDEVDYINESFQQLGDADTFEQFYLLFRNQLATMNNYQRISMRMQLERYFSEKKLLKKDYEQGWTPPDEYGRSYSIPSENENLPF